jgi:hypothetical protein
MNNDDVSCPISGEPAEEVPGDGDYLEFTCPTCGRFRMSENTYKSIQDSEDVLRRSALTNAKIRAAADNSMPIIRLDDLNIH